MKTRIFSFLALVLIAAACASTSIIGSWVDPEMKSIEGKSIAIFCLSPRLDVRDKVETQMSDAFQAKGVNAMRSMDFITPGKMDKDIIAAILKKNNINGVIIVSLLDKEKSSYYVPGSTAYGVGFYGYYGYRYAAVYDPGYYSTTTSYYIECNAYRLADERLVYSSQSKAVDPSSLDKFAYDYSRSIVQDLQSKGVVLGTTTKK
jgi:hypothetical protein